MNWLAKYRNSKKISVIAGILLAITIVTTQSVIYNFQPADQGIYGPVHADAPDSEQEPEPFILSQNAVSVSSFQLDAGKPFQIVCELLLSDDSKVEATPASMPLNFQFFRNLFRTIISPNAP